MTTNISRWHENSVAIERGPLVYALKIEEDWKYVENQDEYGNYYEVYPKSAWNYGIQHEATINPVDGFHVLHHPPSDNPWNIRNAPTELIVMAKMIPEWKMYNAVSGPVPHSGPQRHLIEDKATRISLIPYGCTTLRITEFPVVE